MTIIAIAAFLIACSASAVSTYYAYQATIASRHLAAMMAEFENEISSGSVQFVQLAADESVPVRIVSATASRMQ